VTRSCWGGGKKKKKKKKKKGSEHPHCARKACLKISLNKHLPRKGGQRGEKKKKEKKKGKKKKRGVTYACLSVAHLSSHQVLIPKEGKRKERGGKKKGRGREGEKNQACRPVPPAPALI